FSSFYREHESLAEAFCIEFQESPGVMRGLLSSFHEDFFQSPEAPQRTGKPVATPKRKAACNRIDMFLRWMVRQDEQGVDFGIWNKIKPYQLICPSDLHVDRVARKLGLITRKQTDWLTAVELTQHLRELDPVDPIK